MSTKYIALAGCGKLGGLEGCIGTFNKASTSPEHTRDRSLSEFTLAHSEMVNERLSNRSVKK